MQETMLATARLAEVLQAENAALRAMDLARAAALLVQKQAALAAFNATQTGGQAGPDLRQAAAQLRAAADENRRLLERAISVQTRVLGIIAQAARAANPAPNYGRSGAYAARPAAAWAFSARA